MSVPPALSSSLQVPVGKLASMPAPSHGLDVDVYDTILLAPLVHSCSSFQLLRQGLWDYSIWDFACLPGRAEILSVFPVSWNYPGDPRHLPDSGCYSVLDVSQDFEVIMPCKTSTADPRPWPRLVDTTAVTLPLHSTPMDEASGVQGSLGTQHVSPVFVKLPYPVGQTLPTQTVHSLHTYCLIKWWQTASKHVEERNIKDEHLQWMRNVIIVRKQHSVNKITVVVLRAIFVQPSHPLN